MTPEVGWFLQQNTLNECPFQLVLLNSLFKCLWHGHSEKLPPIVLLNLCYVVHCQNTAQWVLNGQSGQLILSVFSQWSSFPFTGLYTNAEMHVAYFDLMKVNYLKVSVYFCILILHTVDKHDIFQVVQLSFTFVAFFIICWRIDAIFVEWKSISIDSVQKSKLYM